MSNDPLAVARRSYQAYADSDRDGIESLIAEDFRFTRPLDNGLERRTYFELCWPNNEAILDFRFIHLVADGDRVFVTYEASCAGDRRFRNTEILTIRDGQIHEAEVYFGWSIPHTAPIGGHIER